MAKELDADRIERARKKAETVNRKEQERQILRDTIEQNRKGERKVTLIMPVKQSDSDVDIKKLRVAAYCRVSTLEEEQMGSFDSFWFFAPLGVIVLLVGIIIYVWLIPEENKRKREEQAN